MTTHFCWLLLLTVFAPEARAGKQTGFAWNAEALPVTIVWSGTPEGLTHDEVANAIDQARSQWVDTSCSVFDMTFVEGDVERADPADGQNSLVFGDPGDDVSSGNPAVTYTMTSADPVTWNEERFLETSDVDIVFNDDRPWATDESIASGQCSDEWSFQAVLTHNLGHLAGLGHSCDQDEDCPDQALLDAAMYWDQAPCDTTASTVEMDDAWGIASIYGTPVRAECTRDPDDVYSVSCALTEPVDATVSWDFGDGETSAESVVSHVFADTGEHVVEACVTVEACGKAFCYDLRVAAVEQTSDSDDGPSASASDGCGCGCAVAPDASGLGLLAVAGGLFAARRRRTASPGVHP